MTPDLGSPILDVAIGLSFVFFLLSLIVSGLVEAVEWIFAKRARNLEEGLKGMLGEEGLAADVLGHPLVQSNVNQPTKRRKKPSYISARNFSVALIDILAKKGSQSGERGATLAQVEAGVESIARERCKASTQLTALLKESDASSLVRFRTAVEGWFDDAMDRVSGWYKRWAQGIAIVAAVVVAVAFNADAVRITERLYNEATVRSAVVSGAEAALEEGEAKAAGSATEDAVKELDALKLPIGWGEANRDFGLSMLLGFLVTAIALSLGAPFWFDALGRLARLRAAGKKPKPES